MGGTEIYDPLYSVLEQNRQISAREHIILLFTDGAVGNEHEVIQLVKKHHHRIRLFPFGIDTAVNTSFIDGLAEAGNGASEYVYPGERIEDKVIRQFARIHQHALEQPEFVDARGNPLQVVPALPERLYYADSYKFWVRGTDVRNVELRGILAGTPQQLKIERTGSGDVRLLSLAWAKASIAHLEEALEETHHGKERQSIYQQLVDLSTRYGILSTATALFAIHRNEGKMGTQQPETIVVPLAMPAGKLYDHDLVAESSMMMNKYVLSAPSIMMNEVDAMADMDISSKSRKAMPERRLSSQQRSVTDVQESIWDAAQKQQADGQFGSGANRESHTAMFIIAMLMLSKHWKTYRVQIIKAAESLLRMTSSTSSGSSVQSARLLTVIAYERLIEMKLMSEASESSLNQQLTVLKSKLTTDEQSAIEQMLRGDHQPWLKLAGISGVTKTNLKSTDVAKMLLNQVFQGS